MATAGNQPESLSRGPTRAGSQDSTRMQENTEPDKEMHDERGSHAMGTITSSRLTAEPPGPSLAPASAQDGWDKLDCLPFVLSKRALFGFIVINCGILGGLVTFQQIPSFLVNTPSYYALLASLILIGTGTVTHLEAVLLNLSRMTPFILCAREQGATAGESILRSYFPAPSFQDAWQTGNWLLVSAYVIYYPSYLIIGLKSALLYESSSEDDPYLHVNDWACYTLLAYYGLIQLYLLLVIMYLWRRPTGLRWDPVSIADILVLFRHSNFLKDFEGSSIADRQSIIEQLGSTRLYLRYWERDNGEFWHGFGTDAPVKCPPTKPDTRGPSGGEENNRTSFEGHNSRPGEEKVVAQQPTPEDTHRPSDDVKTSKIAATDLALIRYNSAWSVARPVSVYVHFSIALFLMVVFILGVSMTPSLTPDRGYCWEPPGLSRGQANFLFDVVLTSVVSLLSDFWASLSLFVAHTEPLAQMANPSGGPAKHTLLLNYTSSFLPVRIYDAFKNKHWKLVRVVVWELLQRFFPTLVGTSIIVYSKMNSNGCVVCFSMPLFIVVIVGLAVCAGLIVCELLLAPVFRRTPRDYLSISDIVSWSSTSSLLHPHAVAKLQEDSPYIDALDMAVQGERGKRWYMQHRLELQLKHFRLGYAKLPGRECYAFGITDVEPERLPSVRSTHLARRLKVMEPANEDEEGFPKELEIIIGNGTRLYDKLVSLSENTTVWYNNGNIPNYQHQNEQEQPEEVQA